MIKIISLFLLFSLALAAEKEKIQGGGYAAQGEFPYQVSVQVNYQHLCSGALISKRHVLTSGSCIQGIVKNPSLLNELRVLISTTYLLTRDQRFEYPVAAYTVHPNYYYENLWRFYVNDIAILTLQNEVPITKYVKPIKLPVDYQIPFDAQLTATGWGSQTAWNGPDVAVLKKANFRFIDQQSCQTHFPLKLLKDQLCTLPNFQTGTCSSDTGSPLIYRSRLVGISSGSHACAQGKPDLFTNVNHYLQWIFQNTQMDMTYRTYDDSMYYISPEDYVLAYGVPQPEVPTFANSWSNTRD